MAQHLDKEYEFDARGHDPHRDLRYDGRRIAGPSSMSGPVLGQH